MIGIILLIGIVKKNAIMMIDFALAAERDEGMDPREAIYQACLLRFRPIMMTTMCAMLGGLPMAIGWGAGGELRKPLGIAIVGGLIVSQMLTLFTTPVVYLYLDKLGKRLTWRRSTFNHRPDFLVPGGTAEGHDEVVMLKVALFAPLICTACSIGPKYQRPTAPVPGELKEMAANDQWKMAAPSDQLIKGNWWEIFGDPQLNALEQLVDIQNQNVKQAEAQYRQARALVAANHANYYPTIGVNPGITQTDTGPNSGRSSGTNQSYSLPGSVIWEPDLWGRVRLSVQNAAANAQVSAADLQNVRLSAQALLATDYFLLAAEDMQAALLRQTIDAYTQNLQLTINRFNGGIQQREVALFS